LEECNFKLFEWKLLDLFDVNESEISALQFLFHYSPEVNSDVPGTLIEENIRLSDPQWRLVAKISGGAAPEFS
jgi:hypothetical protein